MIENISARELMLRIVQWRKTFLWITIISIVVGGIIVFLLPKQYKSVAIVFPARQFSVSKLVIEANAGNQEDYMQIGDADDCEKLIQILTSDQLKLKVANELNLWKRWKLNDTTYAYHYLRQKWEDMVAIKRTEFNSVRVEVYDYTANGAAQIANSIVDLADTVRVEMNRTVAGQVLNIVEEEYHNTLGRMKELEDSLQSIRNLGVLHYKEQVKAYSREHAKALEKNDREAIGRLQAKLDTLQKYGGAYQNIKDNLEKYSSKYPDIKMKYDEALVNYKNTIPLKFVVERGKPNEYRAKPQRILILTLIVLSTNLIGLFWLLIRERTRGDLAAKLER
jgi:uncharacterized protein involved in exopolysaccharide biosynthesis